MPYINPSERRAIAAIRPQPGLDATSRNLCPLVMTGQAPPPDRACQHGTRERYGKIRRKAAGALQRRRARLGVVVTMTETMGQAAWSASGQLDPRPRRDGPNRPRTRHEERKR